ncbi:MAG TPA: hypothetical protein VNO70_16535 [Blastocatellia bacterium]|nr:hypothetical protein [Blastocatellia bacterium]
MRKQIYTTLMILNLFIALAVTSAQAQHPGTVTAKIPFAFTVGEKTLPAGEYTIQFPAATGLRSRLLIRSADSSSALIVLTNAASAKGNVEEPKLVFTRYGDQHFLSQVFAPGLGAGQEVPKPKGAEKLARTHTARQVVLVNGQNK